MLLFSSDFWQVETVADLYKWWRGVQMRTSPQALLESTVGCISGILTGLDCKVWGNLSKLFREFLLAVRVEVGTWASCTGFVLYKCNSRTKMNDCRGSFFQVFTFFCNSDSWNFGIYWISWGYSEKSMGLRRIKLKCLMVAQLKTQSFNAYTVQGSFMSTVSGWNGILRHKTVFNKCLNCVIISWNAIWFPPPKQVF